MKPFPDEWELMAFFEVEPRLLDDVPWAYNQLTFDTTRGSDRILCVIEPGYERLELTWWYNQVRHLALKLHWISGIKIVTGGGTDSMIATFRNPHLLPLRIQLKPTIECEWGTTTELP